MSGTQNKKTNQSWIGLAIEVIKGVGITLAAIAGIMAACAIALSVGLLGKGAEGGCVAAAVVLGVLMGGLYATGRSAHARILVGVAVGVMTFLLLLTMGVLFFGTVAGGGEMRLVFLACFLGGVLSGVLPALRGKRKRARW